MFPSVVEERWIARGIGVASSVAPGDCGIGESAEWSFGRLAPVSVGVEVRFLPVMLTNGEAAGMIFGEVTTVGLFGLP